MQDHEHASAEEVVAESEIHGYHPIALAASQYEEETQDEEGGDDGNDDAVSEFLLWCKDRQQADHIATHEEKENRGQDDRYERYPERIGLVDATGEHLGRIDPVHIGDQHGKTYLQAERNEYEKKVQGEGIACFHMEQDAETGDGKYQSGRGKK